ncbi:hypothetical protein Tco_0707467 [Tanacetum coccineum]|uniref:Uncharacterized protein n=1 Tax=Tanacetum coccineum TaxID=301880 RepID=A0ABQ4YBU6_9ASTR
MRTSISLTQTIPQEDDSEIPPLEDIHEDATEEEVWTLQVLDCSTPIETQKPLVKDEEAICAFLVSKSLKDLSFKLRSPSSKKQAKPIIKHFQSISEDCLIGHAKTPKNYAPSKKQRMHKSLNKIITWKQKGSSEEDKESSDETRRFDEVRLSTKDVDISTDGSKVSTDKQIEGTNEQVEGTKEHNEGTEENFESTKEQREGTEEKVESTAGQTEATHSPKYESRSKSSFSKEKEKGVELKDVEEIDRPRPTTTRSLLTLKPLPKIDPKDKGKKKIEEEDESESEDDDIPQAARIEADKILAEKLQEQEREQFTIEERAKFLHDTIAAQRKFLAQQRTEAIRNRPPTKNQLRNQMMTYLKHVGNFKHSKLKSKKFEDIQAMYEKIKRSEEDFIARWIDESKRSEEINMNVVTRSNGQKRSFSTLMRVLLVFDREDLDVVYKLVMNIYQDKIPEGFDKSSLGHLKFCSIQYEQDEFLELHEA